MTVPAYSVVVAVGSMAIEKTSGERPVLMVLHEPPPTVLTKTPPKPPAYTVEGDDGSTTSVSTRTGASPPGSGDQFPPPSTVLNTPSSEVPTYAVPGVEGSLAIERSTQQPGTAAVGDHVSPPSALRCTPFRAVTAYTVPGVASTARACTAVFARPVLVWVQLVAPSVLRQRPSSKAPAKTVAGVVGSSVIVDVTTVSGVLVHVAPPFVVL